MATGEIEKTVLIIEDDQAIARVLKYHLEKAGYHIFLASNGHDGIELFKETQPKLTLCDLSLPDLNGLEVLKQINPKKEKIPFIILTAFGNIKTAVLALQSGAFNFLEKPIKPETLVYEIETALTFFQYKNENRRLKSEIKKQHGFENLIGISKPMIELKEMLHRILGKDCGVLLTGESGTGKSLIARLIHEAGPRSSYPFTHINCGAIPENLIESELFGHEKGAFTGAIREHKGAFQRANGGTLFLDEIGELPLNSQVKLLKAIEDQVFCPVGSDKSVSVEVNIITATNKDLPLLMKSGEFREDLYYRIASLTLKIPALRDRVTDLPLLITAYFQAKKKTTPHFDNSAMDIINSYSWPGNIRQLFNLLGSLEVIAKDPQNITSNDFPKELRFEHAKSSLANSTQTAENSLDIKKMEKMNIIKALEICRWNQTKAAKRLNITRQALIYRMKKYQILLENQE